MGTPVKLDEVGDSEDLQALFDSIAAVPAIPVPPPAAESGGFGDSDELQALFDSVASEVATGDAPAVDADSGTGDVVFKRLGHLLRELHDGMRELGYDRVLEDTARQIPDARQRLVYIAQMTEQAASRVLNATDIAKPIQEAQIARANALRASWDKMFANQLSVEEFKALARDTRAFLAEAPPQLGKVNEQLLEIMMAQDFQDLTGQVIKRVVDIVQGLETQLYRLLIEVIPEEKKNEAPAGLLNGPVVSAAGRGDVVTTQTQVDDLLESLGF
ncbi:MAG: protein phosphatase CheZ [Rhodocyclaceae bacterium]|jgi:chemotaxis protein CheZ|nr:protein phosphatase CheZ [Rhodocyclaceae bacterium]